MKTSPGWPFLISRNRVFDYSVIVAPDFLVQSGQDENLRVWTDIQSDTEIITAEVIHPNLGILNIVFQKTETVDRNGKLLRDEYGRPILWIDGLVFRERIEGYVSEKQFDLNRSNLQDAFQKFWEAEEYSEPIASSPVKVNIKPDQSATVHKQPIEQTTQWTSTKTIQEDRRQQLLRDRSEAQTSINSGILYIIIGIPGLLILVGFYLIPKGISLIINGNRQLKKIETSLSNM